MLVLRSSGDRYSVASGENLGAVGEFDLKSTFENISSMTAFTPMRLHF